MSLEVVKPKEGAPPPIGPLPASAEPFRFLLVDDDANDRLLVIREIRRQFPGSEVREISGPEELERALQEHWFNFVITDYAMGWQNGLYVLRRVKTDWPDCPVIMYTGTGNEEVATQALKNGLDDYLIKSPRHPERVTVAIDGARERMKERKQLAQEESRHRLLFEGLPIGLVRAAADGQVVEANEAAARVLGYSGRDAMQGASFFARFEDPAERRWVIDALGTWGTFAAVENRFRRLDGRLIWCRVSARAVKEEDGKIAYFECTLDDVTARVLAEERTRVLMDRANALAQISKSLAEARLETTAVFETAAAEVAAAMGGTCVIATWDENASVLRTAAVHPHSAQAALLMRAVLDEAPDAFIGRALGRVASTGEPLFVAKARIDAVREAAGPGYRRYLDAFPITSYAAVPMKVHGQVIGVMAVGVDNSKALLAQDDMAFLHEIADRSAITVSTSRLHEAAVTELAERRKAEAARDGLAAIVESTDDAVFGMTPAGTITSWNKGAEGTYGYRAQDVVGKSAALLMPPDRPDEFRSLIERVCNGERISRFETRRMTKDGRTIDISLTLSPILAASGAITGYSAIARDVTQRRRADEALQASEERYRQIIETAHEGVWLFDGKGRTTFVNGRMSKMLGYAPEEMVGRTLLELAEPEAREAAAAALAAPQVEGAGQFEVPYRRKDGSLFWALVVTSLIANELGANTGMLAMVSDITQRRAAERMRDEILDVISHEFRTPVTVIQGYAQLLASGAWKPSAPEWDHIRRKIERAGRHLTFLLNSINELSLIREGAPAARRVPVASEAVIREAAEAADVRRPGPPRNLTITVDAGAAEAFADRRKLTIVLAELIDNAVKFAPPGSPIAIRARVVEEGVAIEVEDRGPGVSDATIANIGKPFVQGDLSSTRREGGAGLGLAVAHGLTLAQGGRLELERPAGGGTRVRIVLPRKASPAVEPKSVETA